MTPYTIDQELWIRSTLTASSLWNMKEEPNPS